MALAGAQHRGQRDVATVARYIYSHLLISTISRYIIYARMTTMWTNFVKFGDPTPDTGEWSRVTKDDIRYRVTIAK